MSSKKQLAINAIRDHYENGTELSPKHQEMKKRWSAAFALLCNFHSITQAVPVLQREFNGISEATAYRDVSSAIKLYGDVLKSSKDGLRHILYECAMKVYQLAAKHDDYKAMNSAVANMIKLHGLDRDEPDTPDFAKLQPSLVVTVLADGMEKQIKSMLSGGAINFNSFKQVQDIPYEDVEPDSKDTASK